MMMDFGLAFSFPFQDEEWVKKIVVTAVILLIPILGQIAVMGWMVALTRRVIAGEERPLPDWEDFGGLFMDGLKAFAVGLVYSLPIIITVIPFSILGAIFDNGDQLSVFEILSICLGCFAAIYGFLYAFVWPAALGELAATGEIGAALNIGKVLRRVQGALSAYLIVFVGTMVGSFVAGLGVILCFVGVIFTAVIAYTVQGHLAGQAYKLSEAASS
jgi:hypothetical protein